MNKILVNGLLSLPFFTQKKTSSLRNASLFEPILFVTINVLWKETLILCMEDNNGKGNKLSQ